MASSTSTDLKLELITTGEKAGTWGTITNTNLQILEQAASGYLSSNIGSSDLALDLSTFAVSNGKNLYYKFTGSLTGNRTVTMPDSAERVFKVVLYSDGTNISSGPITKGYYTIPGAYTAVNGDQLLINTSGSGLGVPVTVTLPASPSVGDEVTFIDSGNAFGSNNLTINRNGSNILSNAANLVFSTNGAAFTLVYVNATRGWAYKDNI